MIMFSCIFLFAFCHQVLTLRSYDIINSPERFKRSTDKATDDVDKVRAEIKKVIEQIKDYTEEVQQHVTEVNIQRNKLSEETAKIVTKQKELLDRRLELHAKVITLDHNITAAETRIGLLEANIERQQSPLEVAKKELERLRNEVQSWSSGLQGGFFSLTFPPLKELGRQTDVVKQLEEDLDKTKKDKDLQEANRKNFINEKQTAMEQLIKTLKEEVKLSRVLFNTTELAENVMALQLDLTVLHTNIRYLNKELKEWHDLGEELYSEGLETIHKPLKVISDYLNNDGGFVDDLLGWGIDIREGTHSFYCNETATIDKVLCKLAEERAELPEELETIENMKKSRQ